LRSRYLFHLHTRYTDGSLTVEDYAGFAEENGVEALIFTEHVTMPLRYDFSQFLEDIDRGRRNHPGLRLLAGVEAKILPGGRLDAPDDIIRAAEVVGIACHGFPPDLELYLQSMERRLASEMEDKPRIWVHPGLFFLTHDHLRRRVTRSQLKRLADVANSHGVFGESNVKYGLPDALFPGRWFLRGITGWDIHHAEDLREFLRTRE